MTSPVEPNETEDIFVHPEGPDWVAYQGGRAVARAEGGAREKFYADLHVWIRKHEYERPIWRINEAGQAEPAPDISDKVSKAFEDQADPNLPEAAV